LGFFLATSEGSPRWLECQAGDALDRFEDFGSRFAVVQVPRVSPALDVALGGYRRGMGFRAQLPIRSRTQKFGAPVEVANRVLLEAGTASGREPAATVEINPYPGRFLSNAGVSLGAEDEAPFPMRLLHFRRTFVEKLLAIHGKVELLKRDGQPLVTYSRHYYDLFQLAERPELSAMLRSDEYSAIKEEFFVLA
jgi:hypothetical protein